MLKIFLVSHNKIRPIARVQPSVATRAFSNAASSKMSNFIFPVSGHILPYSLQFDRIQIFSKMP